MSFRFTGLREFTSKIRKVITGLSKDERSFLREIAEDITKKAQRITPKKTGRLRNSYYLVNSRKGVEVRFGRGVPYAMLQHENLTFRHTPPTTAKFLTKTVEANKNYVRDKIREKHFSILGRALR